jgi:hypothetical protein
MIFGRLQVHHMRWNRDMANGSSSYNRRIVVVLSRGNPTICDVRSGCFRIATDTMNIIKHILMLNKFANNDST